MKHSLQLIILGLFFTINGNAQLPQTNGWTQFTASSDSRIIYVSDSDGDDVTAISYAASSSEVGSNPFEPSGVILAYKTINAAKAQVRSGFADWILLKKGDTFTNQFVGLVNWKGKNPQEPILIGSYGTSSARPRVLTGAGNFISFTGNAAFVSIVGIYAEPQTRTGNDEPVGVEILNAPFQSFLIEDCHFHQFFIQLVIQDYVSTTSYSHSGFTVRRSILTNGYKINGGGGGVFMHNIDSILFEENLIDHNGWSATIAGADANGFSHNTYFHPSCGALVFQNNIVSRASAVGIGARCGGKIYNNLLLENPRNIFMGSFDPSQINYPTEFATGEISYNVILGARVEPTYDPGNGITIDRVKNTDVHHNILAHFTQTSDYNLAFGANNIENLKFQKNIVYNWGNNLTAGPAYSVAFNVGSSHSSPIIVDSNDFQMKNTQGYCTSVSGTMANFQFQNNRYFNVATANNWFAAGNFATWSSASAEVNPQSIEVNYTDPDRSIQSYLNSISETGDLDDFIELRKQMNRNNWNTAITANAVNDYIREGFDMQKNTIGTISHQKNSLLVYPNPVVNQLLFVEIPQNSAFQIFQMDGKIILNGHLQTGNNAIELPILNAGLYFIKVGEQVQKIIVP